MTAPGPAGPAPALVGYTATWNADAGQWVAISNHYRRSTEI